MKLTVSLHPAGRGFTMMACICCNSSGERMRLCRFIEPHIVHDMTLRLVVERIDHCWSQTSQKIVVRIDAPSSHPSTSSPSLSFVWPPECVEDLLPSRIVGTYRAPSLSEVSYGDNGFRQDIQWKNKESSGCASCTSQRIASSIF